MVFKPGEINNPRGSDGGTKKRNKMLADKLLHNVDAAVKFVEKSLKSQDFEHAKWAVETIFNRVYGKPHQAVDVDVDKDSPIGAAILQIISKANET